MQAAEFSKWTKWEKKKTQVYKIQLPYGALNMHHINPTVVECNRLNTTIVLIIYTFIHLSNGIFLIFPIEKYVNIGQVCQGNCHFEFFGLMRTRPKSARIISRMRWNFWGWKIISRYFCWNNWFFLFEECEMMCWFIVAFSA